MRLGSINYKKINYSANLELHRKGLEYLIASPHRYIASLVKKIILAGNFIYFMQRKSSHNSKYFLKLSWVSDETV